MFFFDCFCPACSLDNCLRRVATSFGDLTLSSCNRYLALVFSYLNFLDSSGFCNNGLRNFFWRNNASRFCANWKHSGGATVNSNTLRRQSRSPSMKSSTRAFEVSPMDKRASAFSSLTLRSTGLALQWATMSQRRSEMFPISAAAKQAHAWRGLLLVLLSADSV